MSAVFVCAIVTGCVCRYGFQYPRGFSAGFSILNLIGEKMPNVLKNAENSLRAMKNADNFHLMKTAKNRGQNRIWLEGRKLADYGFSRGDMLKKSFSESGYTLVFTKTENPLSGEKHHRIAGSEKRPILDCNGKWVTEFFQGAEFYVAEITHGKITIQPVPKTALDLF